MCHRCKGIGHPARKCSSLDISRTFNYCISLLQAAQEKHKGKLAGYAPHGQRGPFRARPRDQCRVRDSGHGSALRRAGSRQLSAQLPPLPPTTVTTSWGEMKMMSTETGMGTLLTMPARAVPAHA